MALSTTNFAPAGNQSKPLGGVGTATLTGAPTIHTYATPDTVATVNTAGYFNGLSSILKVGDWILATCGAGSGGTIAPAIFIVLSNAAGVVDVSNGTTVTISDTD